MENLKHDVLELVNVMRVQEMRKTKGLKSMPISKRLVFTGNPGTGKTTVARILAELYKEIGVLSKGHLVEVDRSGLVAGYPDRMDEFVNSNPGLRSRFNKYIHFPDYTYKELLLIFCRMCKKYDYEMTNDAFTAVSQIIAGMVENKGKNFANAREIRNLFETIVARQASRVMAEQCVSRDELMMIKAVDCRI